MNGSKSDSPSNWERLACWLVPGLFATIGCTADIGSSPENDGDESVATAQSADTSCIPAIYTVNGGGPLGPREDQICYMTEISPTPNSAYPYEPNLIISHANGYWYATGYGNVSCVPMTCFHSNGAPDQYLLSPMFQATATGQPGKPVASKRTDMWLADSMSFMSMYQYGHVPMMDSNEYAVAHQDTDPTKLNYIVSNAYSRTGTPASTVTTMGYSFFVGIPHTAHPVSSKSYGYRNTTAQLIAFSSGICAITGVALDVNGGYAHIYNSRGSWTLTVSGYANATCYYFDQSY